MISSLTQTIIQKKSFTNELVRSKLDRIKRMLTRLWTNQMNLNSLSSSVDSFIESRGCWYLNEELRGESLEEAFGRVWFDLAPDAECPSWSSTSEWAGLNGSALIYIYICCSNFLCEKKTSFRDVIVSHVSLPGEIVDLNHRKIADRIWKSNRNLIISINGDNFPNAFLKSTLLAIKFQQKNISLWHSTRVGNGLDEEEEAATRAPA